MQKLIKRKKISAKVVLILAWISVAACWSCLELSYSDLELDLFWPGFFSMVAMIAVWVIYIKRYLNFSRSMNMLHKLGLENAADDINLNRPSLPRSEIYCGQQAFLSKQPYAIIPYSQIAWTYLYKHRLNGFTIDKSVIIVSKSGQRFFLHADFDEYKWLLEHYIIPVVPGIVLGYGDQQKQLYIERNPQAAKLDKKK